MQFNITKAKREKIWVKLALMGSSGSGKSYSAFRLASGMRDELSKLGIDTKIILGNTEGSRGRYYANEFDYDIQDIPVDSEPEDYAEFIKYAIEKGYKIAILDSTTHEWKKILEYHQSVGGDFKAWAKATPKHDKFVFAIADSPLHIIVTIRGDDKYDVSKNEQGKTVIAKLGVGGDQRKDFEFEFTATFIIDQKTSMAEYEKDNTHIFEYKPPVLLTEDHGRELIRWANTGEGYNAPIRTMEGVASSLIELQESIVSQCKVLGGSTNKDLMAVLKLADESMNPKKIKDIKVLTELYEKLNTMIEKKETK
jgi:hypothetical protein